MSIALEAEDRDFQAVVHEYVARNDLLAEARASLEVAHTGLPTYWEDVAQMGWLGLHLPEAFGGSGGSLMQAGIVLAELGRAVAPGPLLSSVAVSAVVAAVGPEPLRADLLPGFADGSLCAGIGLATTLEWDLTGCLTGSGGVVLGADCADLMLLAVDDDLVLVESNAAGVVVKAAKNLDPTQPACRVELHGVDVAQERRFGSARRRAVAVFRALVAAQAAGGAAACLEMAVDYAKVRIQFGHTIGTFQAVKHHCADMVVATEICEAVAWDAANALEDSDTEAAELASAVAIAQALPAYLHNAQTNIQVHGGIGFTWEHDAHLYLRRAAALVALTGDRDAAADVSLLVDRGVSREPSIDLPASVAGVREEARRLASEMHDRPEAEQREALITSGLAMPHLHAPWGRGLGPAEQLAVDREVRDLAHPDYGVGAWVIPTIIQHATVEQLERWVAPSLALDLVWCQMFSEPGAGSDAAAISTRAERVNGGWRVTGQKVWISRAQTCNRAIATVRTSSEGRKQAGITMMVIDLTAPGVEVRPLREASDEFGFDEVFLDGVLVPDGDVLGEVGNGWQVARSTLGNERVTVGSTRRFGGGVVDLVDVLRHVSGDDCGAVKDIGALLAESQALDLLTIRSATRAVRGLPPGREGAITKLIRARNTQNSAELAHRLLGPEAALEDGYASAVTKSIVKSRMTSIGGGTTEIMKNLIAERILGLPRDPSVS